MGLSTLGKRRGKKVRSGARVGKVFGITVRIDWSWFFFYALLVWNLYASFGSIHPAWGAMLRWGMGLAAALLFSISVLIHELAHSLVARARQIPVRSITFFMFGGVSNIQDEPDSPGSEFTMALVGPLVSVAIGAILLVAGGSLAGPLKATMHDPSGLLAKLGPLTTLTL